MAARVDVTAPDGRAWTVRRRWLPRLGAETLWGRFRRRLRQTVRRFGDVADVDPGCAADIGEGIVGGLVVIVAVVLAVFVLLPLLVAILDVLLLLVLSALGVLLRVLLRRPWTVEAVADGAPSRRWRVVGWRASGEHVDHVAHSLEAGVDPAA